MGIVNVDCPDCEVAIPLDMTEASSGDTFCCDGCGADLEIITVDPLEIEVMEEDQNDEDEDEDEDE